MSESKAQQQKEAGSHPICIQNFIAYFIDLKLSSTDELDGIYADHVVFKDPIHEISGLDSLKAYFNRLNGNLHTGSFRFVSIDIVGSKGFLQWEMNLSLKKPKKNIQVRGISVLTFEEKISMQQDFFDMGELAYEHIPMMGGIIKSIKKKMARM